MKEEEIDTKPGVIETKPLLSAKKSEVITQLQQKISEIVNECRFEIRLGVFIF